MSGKMITDIRLHKTPPTRSGWIGIVLAGVAAVAMFGVLLFMIIVINEDRRAAGRWISESSPSGHCYDLYVTRSTAWGQEIPCSSRAGD